MTLKTISKTVWILSLISLFTDTASEMLYPILPIYLKSIGFSIVLIGILEGVAEAVAGLSKGYFGKLSDVTGKRVPFVQLGYALSALSKPMMAIFVYPLWIFLVRTLDRFGKGIRTGARDAILSDEATPETKGKIFGLHRAMDTFGAVLGPSLALIYLYFYPKDYINLFYIAFLPGILAIFSTSYLKEKKQTNVHEKAKTSFFSFLNYWKESPENYRKVVIGLLFFTLFNSSDVFLLLKAKDAGLTDTATIGVYIFYNLIFALFSLPLGTLADKIGLKKMFVFGISIFGFVYFGMSFQINMYAIAGLFFLYGIYAAATDGISKAWITNICDKKDTATAIGTYTAAQSICTMIASSLAGFVWYKFGANAAFIMSGIAAVLLIFYFSFRIKSIQQNKKL